MSKFYLVVLILFFATQFGQAQSTDLIIQKTGPTQCYVGQSISYTIVIQNLGPSAADGATFNDNFPANVANVTLTSCTATGGAVCPGTYTLTNSNFSGTIPTLPVNGTVTFVLTMRSPVPFSGGSFSNTATCSPPNGITETDPATNSSTWNMTQLSDIDLKVVQHTVDDNSPFDCNSFPKSYTFTTRFVNTGPSVAYNFSLQNVLQTVNVTGVGVGNFASTYAWAINNIQWSATGTSSVPTSQFNRMSGSFGIPGTSLYTFLLSTIDSLGIGDTLTLAYTLTINNVTSTGCGKTWSWDFRNEVSAYLPSGYVDTNGSNNYSTMTINGNTCAGDPCPTIDLKVVQNTVDDNSPFDCNSFPKSYTFTTRFVNTGPSVAYNFSLQNVLQTVNVTSVGVGNFASTYPWAISNIQWSATGTSSVPTSQFNRMSGSFGIPGTSLYTFLLSTIDSLGVGDTLTLAYTLTINNVTSTGCGRTWSWDFRNEVSVDPPSGYVDINGSNNYSTMTINGNTCAGDPCPTIDLNVVQHTVDDNSPFDCNSFPKSYTFTTRFVNTGPSVAYNFSLQNVLQTLNVTSVGVGNFALTYPWAISNIQWSATGTSSVPTSEFNRMSGSFGIPSTSLYTFLLSTIDSLGVGDTLTLAYTLTITNVTSTGCGKTWSWDFRNEVSVDPPSGYVDINGSNNYSTITISNNSISATDLVVSKSLTPTTVNTGDTILFAVEFQNTSSGPTNPAVWVDTIPAGVEIDISTITCTAIVGSPPCGTIIYDPVARTLTQTIPNMPSNSGVRVTYKLLVTEVYSKTIPSEAYAINSCIDCNTSSNFTQSNFAIVGRCDYKFAGTDGGDSICQSNNTLNLIDYLFLPNKLAPATGGTWTRTSGSGGTFDEAAGTFVPAVGTTSSTFRYIHAADGVCLADTGSVSLSILLLPCTLPIDLLSFQAFTTDKRTVILQWATASETNNEYFSVERSENAIDWQLAINVEAVGNSATTNYYETIDPTPISGQSYYRLKQIDTDGNFSNSQIVAVYFREDHPNVLIYPNPIKDNVQIRFFDVIFPNTKLSVYNSLGQQILFKTLDAQQVEYQIPTTDWGAGVYYIYIKNSKSNYLHRIIKE